MASHEQKFGVCAHLEEEAGLTNGNGGEQENGTRRPMDQELRAMGSILRILDELELPQQRRALLWLADRCKTAIAVMMILEDDGTPE